MATSGKAGILAMALCAAAAGAARAADQTWIDGNANNDWSTAAPNWDAGGAWVNSNSAIFGGTGETVDVDGTVVFSNITFNAGGYTIGDAGADGALVFVSNGTSRITVGAGLSAEISESIGGRKGTGHQFRKAGDGTLVLSGPNSFSFASSGSLNIYVDAGKLVVRNNAALGAAGNWSQVLPGATLRIENGIDLGSRYVQINAARLEGDSSTNRGVRFQITGNNSVVDVADGGLLENLSALSGSGFTWSKTGAGTLLLQDPTPNSNPAHTYSNTTIAAGTLKITNSFGKDHATLRPTMLASNGATFGGAGTLHQYNVTMLDGSTLDPGFSAGLLTLRENLTLSSATTSLFEIGGTGRGSGYDAVVVSNALFLDGEIIVSLINGYSPAYGDTFDLLDWGTLTDNGYSLTLPGLDAGLSWDQSQFGSAGTLLVIPEPQALSLVLVGLAAMAIGRLRRGARTSGQERMR